MEICFAKPGNQGGLGAKEIDCEAEVAKLRLFGGLTVVEIASALEMSEATVKRRWSYVKAWLSRELKRDDTKTEET